MKMRENLKSKSVLPLTLHSSWSFSGLITPHMASSGASCLVRMINLLLSVTICQVASHPRIKTILLDKQNYSFVMGIEWSTTERILH